MDLERKTLGSRRFNREKNVTWDLYFTRYQDIGPQGDLDRENMGKPLGIAHKGGFPVIKRQVFRETKDLFSDHVQNTSASYKLRCKTMSGGP